MSLSPFESRPIAEVFLNNEHQEINEQNINSLKFNW